MFTFLAYVQAGLQQAGPSALQDGLDLATRCLNQVDDLGDPEHFPPRLLLLLASPAYGERGIAAQLVAGVRQVCRLRGGAIPLIGSTVAAVFFDGAVYERGALLICLAGQHLEAKAAAAPVASSDGRQAVSEVLAQLFEEHASEKTPNPAGNRVLLTFLPGEGRGLRADQFYRQIEEGTLFKVPVFGAVSSINDPSHDRPALQFAGDEVYPGAVAAAVISSAYAIGSSLSRGFREAGSTVRVASLSADLRHIGSLENKSVEDLAPGHDFVLLGRKQEDHYKVVAYAARGADLLVVGPVA